MFFVKKNLVASMIFELGLMSLRWCATSDSAAGQPTNLKSNAKHKQSQLRHVRHAIKRLSTVLILPRTMSSNHKSIIKPTKDNREDAVTAGEIAGETATEASPRKKPRNACKHLFSNDYCVPQSNAMSSYGTYVYETRKFISGLA